MVHLSGSEEPSKSGAPAGVGVGSLSFAFSGLVVQNANAKMRLANETRIELEIRRMSWLAVVPVSNFFIKTLFVIETMIIRSSHPGSTKIA